MTQDPRSQFLFEDSVEKSVKRDENQELYKKLALINSQLARTLAYTWEVIKGGGSLIDVATLELGLFPSKEQRKIWKDWIPWARKPKNVERNYFLSLCLKLIENQQLKLHITFSSDLGRSSPQICLLIRIKIYL